MNIALDYDRCYDRDEFLWSQFIGIAAGQGHKIICITMRGKSNSITGLPPDVPIIYTAGKAKVPYVESIGLHIDIWIDDQPYRLIHDAGTGV